MKIAKRMRLTRHQARIFSEIEFFEKRGWEPFLTGVHGKFYRGAYLLPTNSFKGLIAKGYLVPQGPENNKGEQLFVVSAEGRRLAIAQGFHDLTPSPKPHRSDQ